MLTSANIMRQMVTRFHISRARRWRPTRSPNRWAAALERDRASSSSLRGCDNGRRRAYGSITTPPPTVRTGAGSRATKRSPPRSARGASVAMRTSVPDAWALCSYDDVTCAPTSAAPAWSRSRVRAVRVAAIAGSSLRTASKREVVRQRKSLTMTEPRETSFTSRLARAIADRQLGLLEEPNHLGSHQPEPFVVDKIALGQRDHDPRNS